jgi:hypothetical protein
MLRSDIGGPLEHLDEHATAKLPQELVDLRLPVAREQADVVILAILYCFC